MYFILFNYLFIAWVRAGVYSSEFRRLTADGKTLFPGQWRLQRRGVTRPGLRWEVSVIILLTLRRQRLWWMSLMEGSWTPSMYRTVFTRAFWSETAQFLYSTQPCGTPVFRMRMELWSSSLTDSRHPVAAQLLLLDLLVQCFHDRNDQIFGSFSTQNHIAPPTSSLITCLKVERGSEQQELIVLQGVAGNAVLLWIGCVGRAWHHIIYKNKHWRKKQQQQKTAQNSENWIACC